MLRFRHFSSSEHTGYRFGFNGMEKDDEVKGNGNSLAFRYRIHDPRIGRFLSTDPLTKTYPWYTPYQFAGNTPIQAIDVEGLEPAFRDPTTGMYVAAGDQFQISTPPDGYFGNFEERPPGNAGTLLGVAAVGVTLLSPIPGDEVAVITYLTKTASAGLDVAGQVASGDDVDLVGSAVTLLPLPGSELMKEGVDAMIDVGLDGEIRTPFGATGDAEAKSITETVVDGVGGIGGNVLKNKIPGQITESPTGNFVTEGVSSGVENIGGSTIKGAIERSDDEND